MATALLTISPPLSAYAATGTLAVNTTSYNAATPVPGGPVTYAVQVDVQGGSNQIGHITLVHTVPTGVVPVGAFGTEWACQAPSGQTFTCVTTADSFNNGSRPTLTVVAIVASSAVTSALIQNSSSSVATSPVAATGSDTVMTGGSPSSGPHDITVTPTSGPMAGGGSVTVKGSSISGVMAIEIGTTSEQQAGTPVTLLQCSGAAAAGCFTVSNGNLVISPMPARANAATVLVTVVAQGVAAAGSYVYVAPAPNTPATPTATAGITSATVAWVAPSNNGSSITGYTVTPYLGGVAQTPVSFDATATTRVLTPLTAGGSYSFTVAATNTNGTSSASARSAAVTPYTTPGAPTITSATAGSSAAAVSWTAPGNNGGSAITGYVVTPYVSGVAQTPQTFNGSTTTRTVTGLTPGTACTFTVAAQNAAGTGPASAASSSVIPNALPTLTFAPPPAGEVAVAFSTQLTVNAGTAPFVWSIGGGVLPAGLTLNATTGLLSGTPTASGSFAATVRVVDASGQAATEGVTLVIAATPTIAFSPAAGEVTFPYSQQPVLNGGTGPITWAIAAGALRPGVFIDATTGLINGTPTASGTFSFTMTATDSFTQVANRTVSLVIAALPTLTFAAPANGQVGISYGASFSVTGGSPALTWSVGPGSLPPGLSLEASTGTVSGTPTAVGTSSFTVQVVDSFGALATRAVSLVIGQGPIVITKSANASSIAPGKPVTFTITVRNISSVAFNGVTVSDPLTGVLDDAAYNNDASTSGGAVTYTAPTLAWSGNLAAGSTITLTYSVTVNNPDVGNMVIADTVTSPTLGTNCAAGSIDTRCSATVSVAGLTIRKTADAPTTTPGGTVRFTINVTNDGQSPYIGATLTERLSDLLDDATYNSDAGTTSGSVSYSAPDLTWTGDLAVGASATISYSVTVASPDSGDKSLTGTVVSPTAGSVCPSGNPAASCTAAVTVLVPALVITIAAGGGTTTLGGTVHYTVTLSNGGQTAYAATSVTVSLLDVLDDAKYNGDANPSAGEVVINSGSKTLVWTGNLALGALVTIAASVTVDNPDTGDKTLTAVASSSAAGSTCSVGNSNSACSANVQVLVPELTITKSANVSSTTPGSVVRYTVIATNTGQTPYAAAAVLDTIGGVPAIATYNGDASATAGVAVFDVSTLSWTGPLLIGASATITYSVTVKSTTISGQALTGSVSSTTSGNTCPAESGNPSCSSGVPILIPGLSLTTVVDGATTTPGSVVHYLLTATNTGETAYSNVPITLDFSDVFDDATDNFDGAASIGTVVDSGGTSTWTLSLTTGATATFRTSVTVKDPDPGSKVLHSTWISDAQGSACPTGNVKPACRADIAVQVPGLTISKTASATAVLPGHSVSYTIIVTNNGQTSYPVASFADSLDAVLTNANLDGAPTASKGTVTYTNPTISWIGSLARGEAATITYDVTPFDPPPGDRQMTNTVVSSSAGSNCGPGSSDPLCTAPVTVLDPHLTIATTASAASTIPGAVVTYTVVATNSGDADYIGATFSDSLDDVLDDATYNQDASAGNGAVGLVGSTLTWTGDLLIGNSATITYSVTVHALDSGDDLLTSIVGSATKRNNCATGTTDTRCTATVPVARVVLMVASDKTTATPGSVVRLTATITNAGQVPYTGVTFDSSAVGLADDSIPNGDQTASSGTLTVTAIAVTWTGSIPVGGVVVISGTLTVLNPDTGNKNLVGTFVSAAPGNNCPVGGNDPRCSVAIPVLLPGLTITKTSSTTTTVPGGSVDYTITVLNSGQTTYIGATFTDTLASVLDDADYADDTTATIGSISVEGTDLTWVGDLGVSGTATIRYSVRVHTPDTADKVMINAVSSNSVGSNCPPASGDPVCRATVAVLTPALTLVKTASTTSATLGSSVTYTITATNSGQTPYIGAALVDDLAGIVDDAAYDGTATGSGTSYDSTNHVLSWSGDLAIFGTATITYTAVINNPATGDRSMINRVTSTTPGNNCKASSADPRCTIAVPVINSFSLTFTKTADAASTTDGGVVAYTVTVHNATGAAIPAQYTDSLAGTLDDATYDGNANADIGTVDFTQPNMSWSGTVPAGGTATVTYAVTVGNPSAGDLILAGAISSTSLPGSNNCPSTGGGDQRCAVSVTIARLQLKYGQTAISTTPGGVVHFAATFTNTGKAPYLGASVDVIAHDAVDDGLPGTQTISSGKLIVGPSGATWVGDIPVGAFVTLTGDMGIQNPDLGNKQMSATLQSSAPGNNCPAGGSDPSCTVDVSVQVPELTITKAADTTTVAPGGKTTYTITVHNTGGTAYVGVTVADSLIGVLDDAEYNTDAQASTGSLSMVGSTLTWTGDLDMSATATISYSVTVRSPEVGDKVMVNRVTSPDAGSTCAPNSGYSSCENAVAVLTPQLVIASAASGPTETPGGTVQYTVTASNLGQITYEAASFSISLSNLLDDSTLEGGIGATRGTAQLTGVTPDQTLTWTGALAPESSAIITYSVMVNDPFHSGNYRLDQTIRSNTPGNNCQQGTADPRCLTSVAIPGLHIRSVPDVTTLRPTDTVVYTTTLENTGQVPFVGINADMNFDDAMDDAEYNGDTVASTGDVTILYDLRLARWHGSILVGETVTITFSATVWDTNPYGPDAGNGEMTTVIIAESPGSNCAGTSEDPDCSNSVPILTPALTIAQSADATSVGPGALITYTITVTNTGEAPYTAVTVTDSLSDILTEATLQGPITQTSGQANFDNPRLTWTGDVGVGHSITIRFAAKVNNPDLGDRTISNTVISDELRSNCRSDGLQPECSTLVAVLVPSLDIAVTADRNTATPGSRVGYTVTIHNSGPTDFVGATVTIALGGTLDDATYSESATPTSGTASLNNNELTWTGDLAAAAADIIITYGITVNDPDNGDHLLTTTAISGSPGSTCGGAPSCSNQVSILIPGLSVSAVADVATATPGDQVTFSITLTNTGETTYSDSTISVPLDQILDDASFNSQISATIGLATYSSPNLSWNGILHVNDVAVIKFAVTINAPDSGNRSLRTTVVAPESGSACQSGSTNPDCTASVTVLVPGLTIKEFPSVATTTPGGRVGYTITIENTGDTEYVGAVVSNSFAGVLTDATYNGDAGVVGGGVISYGGTTSTWTGDLSFGALVTITFSVTVNDPDTGDKQLDSLVTSSSPGSTCLPAAPQPECSALVRVLVPRLVVTKTADTTTATAGAEVHYTVTVTNAGETAYAPATFTDQLGGVLDDATYNGGAVATVGQIAYTGETKTLAWSSNESFDSGASATITYSVTTAFPTAGNKSLLNVVVSASPGSSCRTGGEGGCGSSVAVLVPQLSITKTADASSVVAGGTVRYTVIATNTGQADLLNANLLDSLAGILDHPGDIFAATATTGTVSTANDVLSWNGDLPIGATVVVNYTIEVELADTGETTLVNTVTSTTTGSNCAPPGDDPACRVTTTIDAQTLSLSDLTPNFSLSGLPNSTVSKDGASIMTVTTNNPGGYVVTVRASTPALAGTAPNSETIPIERLGVRESGTQDFRPLSADPFDAQTVHDQDRPSSPGGDAISNDYQIHIPFVASDTYRTTLDYIVTAKQ